MGDNSGIEWCNATWNPTTGCDRVSPGCDHCYAMTQAKRLKAMGSAKYQTDGNPATSGPGFGLAMHESALDQPIRWTRSRKIFVNSMSDLFHEAVTVEFIAEVFGVMAVARQHTYQILTKRHGRMRSVLSRPEFPGLVQEAAERWDASVVVEAPLPNVWLGVSVENQRWAQTRIPRLLETPAAKRFLSMEPLLGPVNLRPFLRHFFLEEPSPDLDWVIVGGESGRGARPMHPDWAREIRDACIDAGVPFLFKQWGNWQPRVGGPVLVNRIGSEVTRAAGEQVLDETQWASVENVGKHAEGHDLLDGRQWLEYPEERTV